MRVTSTLFHCSFVELANLAGEGSFRQHVVSLPVLLTAVS